MAINAVVDLMQHLQPVDFLGVDNPGGKQCLTVLKQLYDLVKSHESTIGSNFGEQQQRLKARLRKKRKKLSKVEAPLSSLVVENFDTEQVWQELQLQNNALYDDLVSSVSTLAAVNRRLGSESSDDSNIPESGEDNHDDADSSNGKSLPKILDVAQEDEVDSSDEDEEKKLSNFERRARKAEKVIKEIEDEALQPKSWQLSGETSAHSRPENALLEEHLMFDHLIRQAPLVTTETTLKLEDIIKQRIKDQVWDDVERKARPTEGRIEYKKATPLNAEKSKESLAEVYEKEALLKLKPTEEPSVPEYQIEIQKKLDDLFSKLDALSNFHYTPLKPTAEIRVVNNLPSIVMEEAIPITLTDATMLAPSELEAQQKRALKSAEEFTETDKRRKRRSIKKMQKVKRLDRVAKGLEGPNIRSGKQGRVGKTGKVKDDTAPQENAKELKSSHAFFAKLQNQVQTQIKNKSNLKQEPKKSKKVSAIKL